MSTTSSVESSSSIDSLSPILCSACLCKSAISLRSRLCLMWGGVGCACCPIQSFLSHFSLALMSLNPSIAQSMIGHRVSIRARRVGREWSPLCRVFVLTAISAFRYRAWTKSSLSLRLFALGLRANNRRLLEPCCLGGCRLMKLRYCSPFGGSPWYVYFLVFLGPRPTYFSLLFVFFLIVIGGCLISFIFFAVGVTWRFHFPMLLSRLSLLAALGCST